METFRFDLRAREVETRNIIEGSTRISQFRNNIVNLDGSIEFGEWITSGLITKYVDCRKKKPSLLKRILRLKG